MSEGESVHCGDDVLINHTLLEHLGEDGLVQSYYCVECVLDYQNIEEFVSSHQDVGGLIKENIGECTEEKQWEAINIEESLEDDIEHEDNLAVEEVEEDIGDNKYYCYDCRKLFRDLEVAEQHDCENSGIGNGVEDEESMTMVSDVEQDETIEYMCAICEQKFVSLSSLEEHHILCSNRSEELPDVSYENDNAKCQCKICGKIFESIKGLNSHSRIHKIKGIEEESQSNDNFTCQICNTKFTNSKSLKLHLRIHQDRPVRRLQDALPEVAAQNYDRLSHFFCEICNKSFDQDLLTIHKNMHQNIEEFICQICNRQFKNKQSFEVHQQLHSSSSEKNINQQCVINIGPTDAAKRNARNGVKSLHVANAKKTFPCQYCGHLFWRPHEKVRHEYVHTGEKPYPCEVCGKRFRVPYSLTLHLRTHTDIRPYVCSQCNKRFKSHAVYTHHMRTHLNERAFKCNICDKAFRTTVQLYSHKNSHTKPFNCTVCNRPFSSLFAVNSHMKSHDKIKQTHEKHFKYVCDICGAGYGANRALRAHKREIHKIESSENFAAHFDEEIQSDDDDDEHFEANTAAMMLLQDENEQ